MRRAAPLLFAAVLLIGCPSNGPSNNPDGGADAAVDAPHDAPADAPVDAPVDAAPLPDGALAHPCDLPGSVQFTKSGVITVPGGAPTAPSLGFLHLPEGFCAHYFGTVGNARQMRFAPGGELFVASPTQLSTGGGANGQNAIVVLPDDNQDGVADAPVTFLSGMMATQGLLFAKGYFYYQDGSVVQGQTTGTKIKRIPYKPGDRTPSAPSEQVADITVHVSGLHWPKVMDMADDGTIYVGNGGDQGDPCDVSHPFLGGILKLDGSAGGKQVAKGLRNPIAIRCAPGHNQCFALELAKDYTATANGREKLIPIRQGDDWGFPCCATKNLPYGDITPTDCSKVTAENVGFLIGDTPFGLAFAPSTWPGMWSERAIVATHGAAGSWAGARVTAIAMDPNTGLPLPSSNTSGQDMGGMVDFATGWDDGLLQHGRPAAVEFSADGRLFIANDNNGVIFWVAPMN